MIAAQSRPKMPKHIKMRHDPGRGRWIILAPERVFNPDDVAVAVLKRLDGKVTVGEIAGDLAKEYQAPAYVVLKDIIEMLQDLSDKGVVDARDETASAQPERSAIE